MHQFTCFDNFSPKSSPNRLMPETNTQQWNFSGKVFDHRNGDPGLIRCARPWRDNNFFWIQGLYFLNRYLVVAFYQHISTQLPHVLHDVVGKRVVIIDHQNHATHPFSATSTALSKARPLFIVSSNSLSGTESATMPAPTPR